MALECRTAELANYLNITQAKLRQLEQKGILKRTGHNKWDPTKCAAAYIRWLQKEYSELTSDEHGLTQPQAAALLGVTPRRIRQRDKEESPPPKNEAGKYPCDAFGKWMLDDFRRGLGVSEDGTVYDYDGERARLTFHQANSAEMEERRKRRELIPAQEIRQAWVDIVASARAKLLALPSRLASSCAEKKAGELEKEAQSIIYEALKELAEGGDGVPCSD